MAGLSRSYLKTCFNSFWVQVEASLHCVFTMAQTLQSHFVSLALNKKLRHKRQVSKQAASVSGDTCKSCCLDLSCSGLWHTHS